MPRILFDQSSPRGLRAILSDHDVRTAYEMGWAELQNGALLEAAEAAGFDVLVTADQNIQHQQNIAGRSLALVVLGSNHWPTVRRDAEAVRMAVRDAKPGTYTPVSFESLPLRRRPHSPSG
jgi:hypothetical protein